LLPSDLKGFPFDKNERKRLKLKNRQHFEQTGTKLQDLPEKTMRSFHRFQ
jgi:hypothetical protein